MALPRKDVQMPSPATGAGFVGGRRGQANLNTEFRRRPSKGAARGGQGIAAGPEVFYVQITNVNPQSTVEDNKTFIASKDINIAMNDVTDTSTEGWDTKRFLLS